MNGSDEYQNLDFSNRTRRLPFRLIAISLILILFTLLWRYVPHNTLFWILLPTLGVMGWMATFSWRQALSKLILFLHRLERF